MAPNIGVDPGQILGISGIDISNLIGERQARLAADAERYSARKQQQAKNLETGLQLLPDFKIGPVRFEDGELSLGS